MFEKVGAQQNEAETKDMVKSVCEIPWRLWRMAIAVKLSGLHFQLHRHAHSAGTQSEDR